MSGSLMFFKWEVNWFSGKGLQCLVATPPSQQKPLFCPPPELEWVRACRTGGGTADFLTYNVDPLEHGEASWVAKASISASDGTLDHGWRTDGPAMGL